MDDLDRWKETASRLTPRSWLFLHFHMQTAVQSASSSSPTTMPMTSP